MLKNWFSIEKKFLCLCFFYLLIDNKLALCLPSFQWILTAKQDSDEEDESERVLDSSSATRAQSTSPARDSPDVKKRSPSPDQFKSEEEKQLEFVSFLSFLMWVLCYWITYSLIDCGYFRMNIFCGTEKSKLCKLLLEKIWILFGIGIH